tara:strand:+ start:132 stop:902 length:771 start_codon:yes stop_codon:yes gene_type:complete
MVENKRYWNLFFLLFCAPILKIVASTDTDEIEHLQHVTVKVAEGVMERVKKGEAFEQLEKASKIMCGDIIDVERGREVDKLLNKTFKGENQRGLGDTESLSEEVGSASSENQSSERSTNTGSGSSSSSTQERKSLTTDQVCWKDKHAQEFKKNKLKCYRQGIIYLKKPKMLLKKGDAAILELHEMKQVPALANLALYMANLKNKAFFFISSSFELFGKIVKYCVEEATAVSLQKLVVSVNGQTFVLLKGQMPDVTG